MRIVYAGAIVIGIVIVVGIAILLPAFFQKRPSSQYAISQPNIVLSFSIIDGNNVPKWCSDLSSLLKRENLKAIVFITGRVAQYVSRMCTRFFCKSY